MELTLSCFIPVTEIDNEGCEIEDEDYESDQSEDAADLHFVD